VAKPTLILGGGFGGAEAAIFLRKQGLDVTLVSSAGSVSTPPVEKLNPPKTAVKPTGTLA
jgi:NADH dehydrogenase FAD-containing subunit